MTNQAAIDDLITRTLAALQEPGPDTPPPPETTLRERFYELIVVSLGALFPKMPATGQIYDRTTINRIAAGLEDGDAAALGKRTDDWLRLEGLIKQEEGKRAYYLPVSTQAALSLPTSGGLLGDVCATVVKRYATSNPSDKARAAVRDLGAFILRQAVSN